MKIEKGQTVSVNDLRKGKFKAIALEDFDTDNDEWYPLIVGKGEYVKGLNTFWEEGDDIPSKRGIAVIEEIVSVDNSENIVKH